VQALMLTSPVDVIDGEQDYLDAADRWQPGLPFPVLSSSVLERYRSLLGGCLVAVEDAPATDSTPVVVSCGGPGSQTVGRLLAVATGRTHLHADPAGLPALLTEQDGDVALVACAADVDAVGDWPGQLYPRLGVVTARDLPSLSVLIYRTLTHRAAGRGSTRSTSLVHPTLPGADTSDMISVEELRDARGYVAVQTIRGHGRECCVHFADGVLCGRPSAPVVPLVPERPAARLPSCLKGAGCFREDLDEEDREPAHNVRAGVVLLESCEAIALGVGSFPPEVNVALALLDGVAVAVIAPVGGHELHPSAAVTALSCLEEGRSLGETVDAVNRVTSRTSPQYGRFGLLGDPALRLTALGQPSPARAPLDVALADEVRDAVALELATIRSCESLQWLGVPVSSRALGGLRDDGPGPLLPTTRTSPAHPRAVWTRALDEARSRRHLLEQEALLGLAAAVQAHYWQFEGESTAEFDAELTEPQPCPSCGRASASRSRYRHRVETGLVLNHLFCRRCGSLSWSAGSRPPSVITRTVPDLAVHVGTKVPLLLTIENVAPREVHGVVAVAVVDGVRLGLCDVLSQSFALDAGQQKELTMKLAVDDHVHPDVAQVAVLTLAEGSLSCRPVHVDLQP
jgi:hypothetical protein